MTRNLLIAAGASLTLLTLGALAQPEPNRRAEAQADRLLAMDKDGDGRLSRAELPERLADRVFEADTDADGLLTRDELVAFFAQTPRAPAAERAGRDAAPASADFDASMGAAGRALRHLRRTDFGPDARDADLGAVQAMQEALLSAKGSIGTVPVSPKAAERFGDDAAAYERAMRSAMVEAMRATLDLEEAVASGDAEAAGAFVERLRALQAEAHDLFMADE